MELDDLSSVLPTIVEEKKMVPESCPLLKCKLCEGIAFITTQLPRWNSEYSGRSVPEPFCYTSQLPLRPLGGKTKLEQMH